MAKEPETTLLRMVVDFYESRSHYLGIVLLAAAGGIMSYLGKWRSGEIKKFSFLALVVDTLISGFAGVLAALLAMSLNFNIELVFFCSGIAGHLGARGIFLMQIWLTRKMKVDKDN